MTEAEDGTAAAALHDLRKTLKAAATSMHLEAEDGASGAFVHHCGAADVAALREDLRGQFGVVERVLGAHAKWAAAGQAVQAQRSLVGLRDLAKAEARRQTLTGALGECKRMAQQHIGRGRAALTSVEAAEAAELAASMSQLAAVGAELGLQHYVDQQAEQIVVTLSSDQLLVDVHLRARDGLVSGLTVSGGGLAGDEEDAREDLAELLRARRPAEFCRAVEPLLRRAALGAVGRR